MGNGQIKSKQLTPKLEVSFITNDFQPDNFNPVFILHFTVLSFNVKLFINVKRFLGNELRDRTNLMIYRKRAVMYKFTCT